MSRFFDDMVHMTEGEKLVHYWWLWVAVIVVLYVAIYLVNRAGRRPKLDPDDLKECTVCGLAWVGKRDLHVITAVFDESREFGVGAGTSLTAHYCAEHCPGGCLQEKEHAA